MADRYSIKSWIMCVTFLAAFRYLWLKGFQILNSHDANRNTHMLADVVGTSRSLKHGVFIGVRPDMGMRHEHCVEVVVFF